MNAGESLLDPRNRPPFSDFRLRACDSCAGMWKRKRKWWKRLIRCGSESGSTAMEEVGSGSELGSENVGKKRDAETIFSKSNASGFSNSETGENRWGKM